MGIPFFLTILMEKVCIHKRQVNIVDDHKVDHLRETYKDQLFLLKKIKINFKILRYIEKYDFIKQITNKLLQDF